MKIATLLCFLLGASSFAFAQTLQDRADNIHKNRQQPSESIVLGTLKGSDTKFGTSGAMYKDGPAPDQHTLYEIGSITKVFTAILLAETVREGKAKLDDPVGKYLPDSATGKDSPLLTTVTLESLATHTSGLPRIPHNLFEGGDPENPYAHYDDTKLHAYLKKFTDSNLDKPGEHSYSNLGFGLLGHVLERIWDMPYPELADRKIFEPLGMEHTMVPTDYQSLPEEIQKKLATGHNGGKAVPHWELASFLGAGAIISSAHDLLLFARAHWDEDTPKGLAKSLKEVTIPRIEGTGLGWGLSNEDISHGGGTGGFRTHLKINVTKQTAEVDLRNSAGESREIEKVGDFSDISGFWKGTLDAGSIKLRLVRYISADGRIISFSIDQGCGFTEATKTTFKDGKLTASFPTIGGYYEGNLKGDQFIGTWSQSGELPLTFTRAEGIPKSIVNGLAKKFPDDLTPLTGYWSGYLGGKQGLFVYFKVEKFHDNQLAQLFSPDQTPAPISVSRFTFKDGKVNINVAMVGGSFKGKLNSETKTISGTWTQGQGQPLELKWSESIPERE